MIRTSRGTLPLNALRAFEASARHLSFSDAADELGVSATAISHQIRQLEEIIGESLFRRRPRPITLTELGEQLLPDLTHGLDTIERGFRKVVRPKRRRSLKVTSTVAFASGVLLPNLRDWAMRNDDLELEIHGSDQPVNLQSGDLDVAIRYAHAPCENLVWDPLCADMYLPMSAPSFDDPAILPAQHLLQRPLIAYRWKKPTAAEPSWEKWWAKASESGADLPGLAASKIIRISEESNALEAATAGTGIVLASEIITRSVRASGRLQIMSDIALDGLGYWLVYPPSARMDDRISRFHSWLSKILGDVAAGR